MEIDYNASLMTPEFGEFLNLIARQPGSTVSIKVRPFIADEKPDPHRREIEMSGYDLNLAALLTISPDWTVETLHVYRLPFPLVGIKAVFTLNLIRS